MIFEVCSVNFKKFLSLKLRGLLSNSGQQNTRILRHFFLGHDSYATKACFGHFQIFIENKLDLKDKDTF